MCSGSAAVTAAAKTAAAALLTPGDPVHGGPGGQLDAHRPVLRAHPADRRQGIRSCAWRAGQDQGLAVETQHGALASPQDGYR
ncbi:hypothetical protein GCM10020229_43380 [Kitasatospora albolonga]|uniref:hypothetical protein n=1 Tax=Kitasatospora albolonga TaxID=68173 RepID=UPI0031E5E8D8